MRRCAPIVAVVLTCSCAPKLDNGGSTPPDGTHFDAGNLDANADGASDAPGDPDTPNFPDGPPPQLDAGDQDFGTAPPPEGHVDALIDATGGSVVGLAGTPLAGIVLVVPAGALSTPTRIALDLASVPPLPNGVVGVTGLVDVGPAGTVFALPARLTLPYVTTASSPSFAMLSRVGAQWGSLVDPSADFGGATLTASMRRASGAIGVVVTAPGAPSISSFSPGTASVGDVVFVEGKGFTLAPVVASGGASSITLGGVSAEILGWSDTELSFVVPTGAATGTITVSTPAGASSSSSSITIQ